MNRGAVCRSIQKAPDVGIEHPVHLLRQEPGRERIQGIVRAALRPESVGEAEEVRGVDRVQDRDDGALDELIFQRGNAERPLPPVRLRDERPTNRLRPVRSPLEPSGHVLEVGLQGLPVVPPGLAIDAGGRSGIASLVRRSQSPNVVDMVQERGEPLLPVRSCCLTYPVEGIRHAPPALRPARGTPERVPLGQPPSLPRLRSRFRGVVRRLPRYYRAVRLPPFVPHRRVSLDFPMRPTPSCWAGKQGISRFPRRVLPRMLGVSDRAGSWCVLRWRRTGCGLPPLLTASAPRSDRLLGGGGLISRLHTRPARSPVNASLSPLRTPAHDSGSAWVAGPSLCETFIHCTMPV